MPNTLPNILDVHIVRMYKALFDQAPGYTYLTAYRQLGTLEAISADLNSKFAGLSNAQWAANIATNLHMSTAQANSAVAYLTGQLNSGALKRTDLPGILLGYANNFESDGLFGANAAYFNESNRIAYQYSINPANNTIDPAILAKADEPNTAPTVGADAAVDANEGGALKAGLVSTNDSDADGDPLTYSLAPTQAPVPGLTFTANGGFLFDPTGPGYDFVRAGTTYSQTVNYVVSDGQGGSTNGSLVINVAGANDAPVASGLSSSVLEDRVGGVVITPASTDVDQGDSATYSVATAPLNGSVTVANNQFTYTPNANFNGVDSFTYRVTDGSGATSTAIVTINVLPVNDAPTAVASSASGAEDTAIGGTVTGTDTEGTTLSFAVATGPTRGTVQLNTNGSYIYTPNADFNGSDSFTFTANDGLATSAAQTVTITVGRVNDAPVAVAVTSTGAEDAASIVITGASTDVDRADTALPAETASYSIVSQPAHGTVTVTNAATGAFSYVPNLNFNGTDVFVYRVTDREGLSSLATATVTVTAVNDQPVAENLTVTGFEDSTTAGQVTATDVDGDSLTYRITGQPANGTVTMDANGNFVYTPAPNYFNYDPDNGLTDSANFDTFSYVVNDGTVDSVAKTVTLRIKPVADVLTTGIDAVSGSLRNDVWLANQATLNAGDSVNGGAGSDTLIVSVEGDAAGDNRNFASFVLQSVETLEVTNDSADTVSFDMSSSSGVQLLRSTNSTNDVRFNYANTVADSDSDGYDEVNLEALNLTEGVSVTLDVRNDDAAGLDEVNLRLTDSDDDGLDANEISITAEGTGAVDEGTDSGVELVNITTTGSTGGVRVNDLNTPGTTVMNITTAAGLTIGDTNQTLADANGEIENPLSASVTTVNAAGSTAGVVVSTRDTNNSVTITGGSGHDRFEAGNGHNLVNPGAGNDAVYTGTGWDTINGGEGNDSIRASDGNNNIDGGVGNDHILSGSDNDTIVGGEGNDTVNAGDGSNNVSGGTGNDAVTVGTGNDTVDAGDGNDAVDFTGGGADIINGGAGNDTLNAGGGLASDYSEANAVNNTLSSTRDQVDGGADSDVLNLTSDSGDANELDMVRNVETINLTGGGSYSIQVNDGSWFDTDTTGTTVSAVGIGGTLMFDGNDDGVDNINSFTGNDGVLSRAITVLGGNQNDTITTGLGGDSIDGNGGEDLISSGAGNDTVRPGTGIGDNVDLGAGDDLAIVLNGHLDIEDTINGGNGGVGTDVIRFDIVDNNGVFAADGSSAVLGDGISNIDTLLVNDQDGINGDGHSVNVVLDTTYTQPVLTIDASSLDSDEALDLDAHNNAANENLNVIGGAGGDFIGLGDNFNSQDTVDGNDGTDRIEASTVVDADFTNVTEVEELDLIKPDNDSATLGAAAQAAGIRTVYDDAGNDTINAGAYTVGIRVDIGTGTDSVTTGSGNDTVNDVGNDNDTISTGGGNDAINTSGNGNDVIDGGTGNDTVDGLGGNDNVTGGGDDDTFIGYGSQVTADDVISGGTGNDTLTLSDAQGNVTAIIALPNVTSVDNIVAQDADTDGIGNVAHITNIAFVAGSVATLTTVNVSGRGFNGAAYGTGGDALNVDLSAIGDKDYAFNITGGLGNDTVTGSALPENLNYQAGGGDDRLNVDATDLGTTLTMAGGAGVDTINMLSGALTDDSFGNITGVEHLTANGGGQALDVQLGAQADGALDETTLGYISVTGTDGNDALLLDAAFNDEVRVNLSTGGNDTVNGLASSSRVVIIADAGDIDANDVLTGGTGTSDAMWLAADNGAASPNNATRIESYSITEVGDNSATLNIVDNNFTGVASNTLVIDASALNDSGLGEAEGGFTLNAGGVTTGKMSVTGGTGADSITTGGGADTIHGGASNPFNVVADTVDAGGGDDVVTTNGGSDQITAGTGNDSVNAGDGNNTVWAGTGNDTVTTGAGADSIEASDGNDRVASGGGNDTVFGGIGDDSVDAGGNNDQVSGEAGNDTIAGGDGDDTLIGGAGADAMNGGAGADVFIYHLRSDSNGLLSAIDTITGFTSGQDVLDIRYVGLDPAVVPSAAGRTLVFGGNAVNYADATAVVHNGDGIIQAVFQQDEQVLWVDLNDDGSLDNNDLRIRLSGTNALAGADIMSGATLGTILVANGTSKSGTIANDHFTAADGAGVTTLNGGDGADTLLGGTGPDVLNGDAGNDSLVGNGGSDVLTGGVGNDNMTGGADADTFNVDSGNDTITDWGNGADFLNVSAGATATVLFTPGDDSVDLSNSSNAGTVVADALAGNDSVIGTSGFDSISGSAGNDTLRAGNGNDWVSGGGDDDDIHGGSGTDTLSGDSGNDTIDGDAGADVLMGGDGDDLLQGEDIDTLIDGGSNTDTMDIDEDFNDASDEQLINVEVITLTDGDELELLSQTEAFTINGDGSNETVVSGSGDDTISGNGGNDSLNGGDGADEVSGGTGGDTIVGASNDALLDGGDDYDYLSTDGTFNDSNDSQIVNIEEVFMSAPGTLNLDGQSENLTVNGSTGNDTIVSGGGADSVYGNDGNDSLNGGGGIDSVYGQNGNDTIVAANNDALFEGGSDTDTLQTDGTFDSTGDGQIVTIEAVTMSAAGTLTLDDQTEGFTITGSSGADTIIASLGADTINGGNGNDSIDADEGADSVDGGGGNDTIVGSSSGTNVDVLIDGNTGTDTLQAEAGFDDTGDGQITRIENVTMSATGTLDLTSQTENLNITGDAAGGDTIDAGSGNDTVSGGGGADDLDGGQGTDSMVGGAGNDTIDGGAGNDTLVGGADDDTYNVTSGTDTINRSDWIDGTNVLNVSVGATARVVDDSGAGSATDVSTATNNGTIVIEANGGADTVTGSAGADSILGGAGDDDINSGAGADTIDGGTGNDLVTLTADATSDRIVLETGATPGTDTVANFLAGAANGDVIAVGQTGTLQIINSPGTFDLVSTAANGHAVLITSLASAFAGALTDVSDNGLIEQVISGAIENVSPGASTFGGAGSWFTVILDNGTDTGVYKVSITSDDGNLGSGDFSVALIGVLNGVDADNIVDANIG